METKPLNASSFRCPCRKVVSGDKSDCEILGSAFTIQSGSGGNMQAFPNKGRLVSITHRLVQYHPTGISDEGFFFTY